jgi:hypothetical protein
LKANNPALKENLHTFYQEGKASSEDMHPQKKSVQGSTARTGSPRDSLIEGKE